MHRHAENTAARRLFHWAGEGREVAALLPERDVYLLQVQESQLEGTLPSPSWGLLPDTEHSPIHLPFCTARGSPSRLLQARSLPQPKTPFPHLICLMSHSDSRLSSEVTAPSTKSFQIHPFRVGLAMPLLLVCIVTP